MSKKILVTGASGGFGQLIVQTLLEAGHKVAASMRNSQDKNKDVASKLSNEGAVIVEIDVTNESSVQSGVEQTIDQLGGLDVVINNAGVGVLGIQEMYTAEDWQKLFDINVFGVQRINRAALPFLRSQGTGLLIHVTSLLGRMALPFYGPYNASKWAMEAMAENYRIELSAFGIDSCIVEPGGFATSFMDKLMKPSDTSQAHAYGEFTKAPETLFNNFEGALANNPAQDPQNVAEAVLELIETPDGSRPLRTVVDKMGMGDHINGYNDHLDKVTRGIYTAFGMEGMLELKTSDA